MIDKALDFICNEIKNYLVSKSDLNLNTNQESPVALYNISQLGNDNNGSDTNANVILSLVNIEEDRISKSQENFIRNNGTIVYKNPKIFLNLFLLFAVNNTAEYKTSLTYLSYIIQFFQYQNVFTSLTNPGDINHLFPGGVDELIFDLYTLSFQDLNNLWGIMGSKYLPSVMYKMRLVVIDEGFEYGQARLIQNITVNDKTLR